MCDLMRLDLCQQAMVAIAPSKIMSEKGPIQFYQMYHTRIICFMIPFSLDFCSVNCSVLRDTLITTPAWTGTGTELTLDLQEAIGVVETETCTATRTIWEEEWTEVGRTAEGSASVGGSVGRVPNGADLGVHGHCERC